jgi:diaminopimelate decarboxylase
MTTNEKDAMAKGIFVPDNLGVYDWICISGMGAYTYGQKSTFSGM